MKGWEQSQQGPLLVKERNGPTHRQTQVTWVGGDGDNLRVAFTLTVQKNLLLSGSG